MEGKFLAAKNITSSVPFTWRYPIESLRIGVMLLIVILFKHHSVIPHITPSILNYPAAGERGSRKEDGKGEERESEAAAELTPSFVLSSFAYVLGQVAKKWNKRVAPLEKEY